MSQPLRLGIAGLGTVGAGLLSLLHEHGERLAQTLGRRIEIQGVSARSPTKKRSVSLDDIKWFDEPERLAVDPSIDVFVELIGGEEGVARRSVEAALKAGKHVVTANKALLAYHGPDLAKLAEKHGVALNFEAAVAGAIPIIKTLREALAGNQVRRVYGILNGTCNYILTKMQEEGRQFADVLEEAQAKGYAEADPTFDVETPGPRAFQRRSRRGQLLSAAGHQQRVAHRPLLSQHHGEISGRFGGGISLDQAAEGLGGAGEVPPTDAAASLGVQGLQRIAERRRVLG